MAKKLDRESLYAFLSTGHRTAKIALVKSDGSPVVSPVWFVLDNNELVFNTMSTSLKGRLLKKDPRVSICVEDDTFPYGFATIRGHATLHSLPVSELKQWTTRIAARYVPADRAAEFGERNAVEEELLVRVNIVDFFAFEGVAD